MRCFLAIEIPDDMRERLAELQKTLRSAFPKHVSWVKPENLHLTLRFLGDTTDERITSLVDGIGDVSEKQIALLRVSVSGLGVFPKPRAAPVLWTRVNDPSEQLAGVQAACELAACAVGYEPEQRAWSPHITLARFRKPPKTATLTVQLDQFADWSAGEFAVEAVSLFKSELSPRGAVYTRLDTLPLPWISPPEPSTTS